MAIGSQELPRSTSQSGKPVQKSNGLDPAFKPNMTSLDAVDSLTERIIGCAIEVHRVLGPGLLESVYRDSLQIELRAQGIAVERNKPVKLEYRGRLIGPNLWLDLHVDRRIVVEVKAVERMHPVYLAQVMTYLKLTGSPAGLLLNFNVTSLRAGIRRLTHPDLYAKGVRRHQKTVE